MIHGAHYAKKNDTTRMLLMSVIAKTSVQSKALFTTCKINPDVVMQHDPDSQKLLLALFWHSLRTSWLLLAAISVNLALYTLCTVALTLRKQNVLLANTFTTALTGNTITVFCFWPLASASLIPHSSSVTIELGSDFYTTFTLLYRDCFLSPDTLESIYRMLIVNSCLLAQSVNYKLMINACMVCICVW